MITKVQSTALYANRRSRSCCVVDFFSIFTFGQLLNFSFCLANVFMGRQVGPAKYMEVVNACKPDLWASLPDEVPSWVTEKRNRMSVDRTLQWLDHCLSLQPVCHISIQTTF